MDTIYLCSARNYYVLSDSTTPYSETVFTVYTFGNDRVVRVIDNIDKSISQVPPDLPRCLRQLGQVCVARYEMCGVLHGDNHFHARLARLFERIIRPDWCAAGRFDHAECVSLRGAARAGPSGDGDGPPLGLAGRLAARTQPPREDRGLYFNAKYVGEAGDWADIAYELSFRRG